VFTDPANLGDIEEREDGEIKEMKWEDLTPSERKKYINQDQVNRDYIFVDPDTFSTTDMSIVASIYKSCSVEEYGVDDILDLLTEKQREVVVLRFIKGKSEYKIADMIGISRSGVEKRIRLARQKLRNKYNEVFINKVSIL
jgi:RNA polymerase sigma factor (sigma-70 family)